MTGKMAALIAAMIVTHLLAWNAGFNKGSDVSLCAVAIFQNDGKWPIDSDACNETKGWGNEPLGMFRRALPDAMK